MTNIINNNIQLTDDLYKYILNVSLREDKILQKLRTETLNIDELSLQSSPEQMQFISLILKLINARNVLEIGVYKGYSTLWIAQALPEDGKVVACDINKKWTDEAKKYWNEADVLGKIDLYIDHADNTLNKLINQGYVNGFDLAFIDADKKNYDLYYELCLKLIAPGGLILVDNTLWYGKVIDLKINDEDTVAIRNLNLKIKEDNRVDLSLLPIRDGLTLLRKR